MKRAVILIVLLGLLPALLWAAIISSTFTGSENPLSESGVWSNPGTDIFATMKKVSGEARSVQEIAADALTINSGSFANDQCSEVTVGAYTASADNAISLIVRGSGTVSFTGYWGIFANGNSLFLEGTGDDFTAAPSGGSNSTSTTLTSGDIAKMCIVGTTMSLYKNGTLVNSTSDATIASGKAGFGISWASPSTESTVSVTDWRGGAVSDFAIRRIRP